MTSVADNFNRADETPLAAPWTKHAGTGTINLSSNALARVTSGDLYEYYAGAATGADQFSKATVVAVPSGNDWGPAVRIGGAGHATLEGYFFECGAANALVGKHVNGAFTSIASFFGVQSAGDNFQMEIAGSAITCYRNGVVVKTTTDTSLTLPGNGPGLFWFNASGTLDDWSGGDLAAPTVSMRPTLDVVGQAVARGSRG
jgi:hypothetical protein